MASLLTATDTSNATGVLGDHFDTFKRDIVVNKEPIKTAVPSTPTRPYVGYGPTRTNPTEYTFTPVSGVYSALVMYKDDQNSETLQESQITFDQGDVRIKVQEDGKNYIENGKTENINIDGFTFNVKSKPQVKNFLGLKYYVYMLERSS